MYPCAKCNQDGVNALCGLTADERLLRFDQIRTTNRAGTLKAVSAAKAAFDKKTGMLALCGGYGTGKTRILKTIVAEYVAAGIEARYLTVSDLLAYAREAFDSGKQGDSDFGRIAQFAKVHVLCLDELDKVRQTEYAREIQTHLFDKRYSNANALLTVAAWNGTPDELGMPWVVSRFSQYGIVHNTDSDLRQLLGKANQ